MLVGYMFKLFGQTRVHDSTNHCLPGAVIRPVNLNTPTLDWQAMSVAEIMRAVGIFLDVAENENARSHEIRLEAIIMDYNVMRYSVSREPDETSPWTFVADNPIEAEEAVNKFCANIHFWHMKFGDVLLVVEFGASVTLDPIFMFGLVQNVKHD